MTTFLRSRPVLAGAASLVASVFGFSLMALCVRLADDYGAPLPAAEKAFFRNFVAVLIAATLFIRTTGRPIFTTLPWGKLLARSILGTLGIVANFYALSRIPLPDAMALNKTAPFFSVLFCWLLAGERMSAKQTLCLIGAFIGALFVVKPGVDIFSAQAGFIGLSSGMAAGAAYAMLHLLGRAGVPGPFIVLFFSGFSCLVTAPFLFWGSMPVTGLQLLILAGSGVGAAIGQFGITAAYRFTEPRRIAIFDYSGIFFAAIWGFLVFSQIPDIFSIIGFTLIILMAFLMVHR